MGRIIPFDEKAICDECGAIGAFDFMGDYLCGDCASKVIPSQDSRVKKQQKKDIIDIMYLDEKDGLYEQ